MPPPGAGHVAVVTGASSGIGACIAMELARRGYPLVLVARRHEPLAALAERITSDHGVPAQVRCADLSDDAQRAELVAELRERPVAALVNNAGFASCGPLRDAEVARELQEVRLNVVATHELTLAVLPGMLREGRGGLLFSGSTAGMQPVPTAVTYSSTKSFVNTFAEGLHGELAGTGVSCTLLAPGPVSTPFYDVAGMGHLPRIRILFWLDPERVARAAVAGLIRGRRVVVPGPMAVLQGLGGRFTPRPLLFFLLRTVILPILRRPAEPGPHSRVRARQRTDRSPAGPQPVDQRGQ